MVVVAGTGCGGGGGGNGFDGKGFVGFILSDTLIGFAVDGTVTCETIGRLALAGIAIDIGIATATGFGDCAA